MLSLQVLKKIQALPQHFNTGAKTHSLKHTSFTQCFQLYYLYSHAVEYHEFDFASVHEMRCKLEKPNKSDLLLFCNIRTQLPHNVKIGRWRRFKIMKIVSSLFLFWNKTELSYSLPINWWLPKTTGKIGITFDMDNLWRVPFKENIYIISCCYCCCYFNSGYPYCFFR